MDTAQLAALIVACSSAATVLTTFLSKWVEEVRLSKNKLTEISLESEKLDQLSVESAAQLLERHATRLDTALDKERQRRETLEDDFETRLTHQESLFEDKLKTFEIENNRLQTQLNRIQATLDALPKVIKIACVAAKDSPCPILKALYDIGNGGK